MHVQSVFYSVRLGKERTVLYCTIAGILMLGYTKALANTGWRKAIFVKKAIIQQMR